MDLVFRKFSLAISNAEVQFEAERLTKSFHTTLNMLSSARLVELIDKHEFPRVVLDKNSEMHTMHIAALETSKSAMLIYFCLAPLLSML